MEEENDEVKGTVATPELPQSFISSFTNNKKKRAKLKMDNKVAPAMVIEDHQMPMEASLDQKSNDLKQRSSFNSVHSPTSRSMSKSLMS